MDGIQTLFRLARDRDTAPLGAEVLSRSGCGGTPRSRLGGTPCSGCSGTPRSGLGGTPCSGLGGTPCSGCGGAPHSERATRSWLDEHIIQPDR